jgi:D-aminopeptidase
VQANFGGVLSLDGVPVGKELGQHDWVQAAASGGSCMIVVATDAPLDARELRRLARRAVFALARTGSSFTSGSGDYAIAFSTAPELRVRHGDTAVVSRPLLPSDAVSPLFQAVLETTEEAVYNALLKAETTAGNGMTVEAIPVDSVRALLKKYGRHPER